MILPNHGNLAIPGNCLHERGKSLQCLAVPGIVLANADQVTSGRQIGSRGGLPVCGPGQQVKQAKQIQQTKHAAPGWPAVFCRGVARASLLYESSQR